MSGEAKDPAIKLFGKTIPLPDIPPPLVALSVNNTELVLPLTASCSLPENKQRKQEDDDEEEEEEDIEDEEDDKELQDRNRGSSDNDSDRRNKSKSNNSQDKTLKKPDKILPCPRCNSMDTKFCYYNNYNVNQPRHFCKNCQRYWTAGGTMRNVPVGAGRRKNKTAASNHYHQVTTPEILPSPPETKPDPHLGFPTEIPGPHWPYPWSPVPPPGICPPVVPPFYPAPAYWVPLLPQPCFPNSSSGLNSPTLGKRSRDEAEAEAATAMVRPNGSEPIKNQVLMPKTLRIYDPREAAKSSIWAALSESPGGGIFKGFQPKGHDKNHIHETDSVLLENPAALSRSLNFHEAI